MSGLFVPETPIRCILNCVTCIHQRCTFLKLLAYRLHRLKCRVCPYSRLISINELKLQDFFSKSDRMVHEDDLLELERKTVMDMHEKSKLLPMDAYLKTMDPVISSSVTYELQHAKFHLNQHLSSQGISRADAIAQVDVQGLQNAVVESASGIRLGISSANASDNYTFAGLEPQGGRVLNASIVLLDSDDDASSKVDSSSLDPVVSVRIELRNINEGEQSGLLMESDDRLPPVGLKQRFISSSDMHDQILDESPQDPFRLVKRALMFTGLVCAPSWGYSSDVKEFSWPPNKRIHIMIRNRGPSRSGFASSSSVSLNLLNALYTLQQNTYLWPPISQNPAHPIKDKEAIALRGLMVWLFENECGLRSGRQDVDAPLVGGLNAFHYGGQQAGPCWPLRMTWKPFTIACDASIKYTEEELLNRLILVDTGIPRTTSLDIRRGLNMRHLSYLTRQEPAYSALFESLRVHDEIVHAFSDGHWSDLGRHMLEYMRLRELIDPTALKCPYDESMQRSCLRFPFERLREGGLIEGGMLSGAMGGGVMMLIATPLGSEVVTRSHTRLDEALGRIRDEFGRSDGDVWPFSNLRVLKYRLYPRGITTTVSVQ